MTKNESLTIKGVAILLMLYLHLFNRPENAELCRNLLYVGGLPLAHVLTRAANPVSFFLILSGYGLYVSHHRGKYRVWHKLKALYVHYWIVLFAFVTLGCWMVGAEKYPGDAVKFLESLTAWNPRYNGEMWFLFPYMLVMLTSKWIVRALDRVNPWLCTGALLFLNLCCGFLISRYGSRYLYDNQLLYKPVLYIDFLFPFALGAYMAKYRWADRVRCGGGKYGCRWIGGRPTWLLLAVLVAMRCCFRTSAFHTLYVLAFILLFVNAPRAKWLDGLLQEMGRRSTSMWFVHSWFCYYLFHDFVYGLRYPLLIFAFLVAVSWVCAIAIDKVKADIAQIF